MTFNERVIELANLIGADIGDIVSNVGDVSILNTNEKIDLVSAINEIHQKTFSNSDILISSDINNVIKQQIDGLYAEIEKPDDILSFTSALDSAINKL